MAIRFRRGAYADFDPSKMLTGEPASVLTGDPNTSSGSALYLCFGSGTVKRIVSVEELQDTLSNFLDSTFTVTGKAAEADAVGDALGHMSSEIGQNASDIYALDGRVGDMTSTVTLMLADIGDAYSTSSTYAVGDYCIYEDRLYRCVTAISAPESWHPTKWTAVNLADDLAALAAEKPYVDANGIVHF